MWKAINDVPDEELWRVHERRRHRLIIWTRQRLRQQLEARGVNPDEVRAATDALSPNALTVGFARRFATYKRGTLLLRDAKRLKALLANATRPIQFLIAGKAHPADGGGKDLIRQIVHFAKDSEVGHKIVFIENYDINVARYLVQGCDVWLNTPRRGLEASGTSGMKAALNGVLNCSILDGWWDEASAPELGWAIGRGESYANPDIQDEMESQALYRLLEQQIIPLFYERDLYGMPRGWLARMKKCISVLAPAFNTNRMVQDYAEKLYLPSLRRTRQLSGEKLAGSVALAHQKYRLRDLWGQLKIEAVKAETSKALGVHGKLGIEVVAHLGTLTPAELRVQVYTGALNNDGHIAEGAPTDLTHVEDLGQGKHRFIGTLSAGSSGRYGFATRIVPGGAAFADIVEPGLIRWEK